MRLTHAMRRAHTCRMKNPITSLREAIDLTQEQFAGRLGRTQSTVSRWESGEQMPDGAALKDLQRLGLNVGAFLAWTPVERAA